MDPKKFFAANLPYRASKYREVRRANKSRLCNWAQLLGRTRPIAGIVVS
jgi:hypothetical protein